jgi:hypothetical protein
MANFYFGQLHIHLHKKAYVVMYLPKLSFSNVVIVQKPETGNDGEDAKDEAAEEK